MTENTYTSTPPDSVWGLLNQERAIRVWAVERVMERCIAGPDYLPSGCGEIAASAAVLENYVLTGKASMEPPAETDAEGTE
jgi:hypothetical protein